MNIIRVQDIEDSLRWEEKDPNYANDSLDKENLKNLTISLENMVIFSSIADAAREEDPVLFRISIEMACEAIIRLFVGQ